MMDILLCFVTAPSQQVASELAKLVVDRELAACVNMIPGIRSVYRWKSEVTLDEEVLMVIKTSKYCVQELEQLIIAEHPYETPEFVALTPSSVSDAYAKWVVGNSSGGRS